MHRLHKVLRQLAAVTLLSLAACQGGTKAPLEDGQTPFVGEQTIQQVLADLSALPAPEGVSASDFAALKNSLRGQLLASGQGKITAKLPSGSANSVDDIVVTDNGDGTALLTWTYRNRGDYDLNGMVNISDLSPLGANLGRTVDPTSSPRLRAVDGNGDGFISISDLTPLGAHFMSSITGYEVYYRDGASGGCWESAATVDLGWFNQDLPIVTTTVTYSGSEQFIAMPFNPQEPANPYEDYAIPTPPPPPPPPPPAKGAIGGQVLDELGMPLMDVVVSLPELELTTVSDADGRFEFNELEPAEVRVVGFQKMNYADGSVRASVASGQTIDASVTLLSRPNPIVINASAGGVVAGLVTSVKLTLPPDALVDSDGMPLTDDVDIQLTYIDPTDPAKIAAAPGDMSARMESGDEAQLESFGMAEVFINDGTGQEANLAAGQTAELEYTIPAELQASAPDTMPMFSFDEATGQWVEEGLAIKSPDGTKYVAEVPHFSYWNCDLPLDYTCVRVEVVSPDGAPVAGAKITATGVDYTGTSYEFTDAEGSALFHVKPESTEEIVVEMFGVTSTPMQYATPPATGKCDTLDATEIPTLATVTVDSACVDVLVTTTDGEPIPYSAVTVTGVSYEGSHSVFADDTGLASFQVKPEATITLRGYKGQFVGDVIQVTTPASGCSDPRPLLAELTVDYNLHPTALFNFSPQTGKAPLTVTFDARPSEDKDGTIALYEWDWDGPEGPLGFESNGSDPIALHLMTVKGYSYPTLRVTDDQGKQATFSRYICFN